MGPFRLQGVLESRDFRFLTPLRCVRNDSGGGYAKVSAGGQAEARKKRAMPNFDLGTIDWQAIGAIATALVAALALSERLLGLWERIGIGTRWLGETDDDRRRAAVVLRAMFEYWVGEVQLSEDEGALILPLNEGISIQPRADHGYDPAELIFPGVCTRQFA